MDERTITIYLAKPDPKQNVYVGNGSDIGIFTVLLIIGESDNNTRRCSISMIGTNQLPFTYFMRTKLTNAELNAYDSAKIDFAIGNEHFIPTNVNLLQENEIQRQLNFSCHTFQNNDGLMECSKRGGNKYVKTDQRVKIGSRNAVVYKVKGSRARYIKRNNEYVQLSTVRKS